MILYKKDSKGNIRSLEITTEDNYLIRKSGLLDGKQIEHRTRCRPKNIGKCNETTGIQQAKAERESLIEEKLKNGYFKTIIEAKTIDFISPMLAYEYNDYKNKIDWTVAYVQPKLDGMRCLAIMKDGNITLMSRLNTEITTMKHITDELQNIYKEGYIIDGELYSHGDNFQTNMEYIKSYKPGESEKIKYHVYDMISDIPFIARFERLRRLVEHNTLSNILLVSTTRIPESLYLSTAHQSYLRDGYEGTIIRWGYNGYKTNSRSSNLLKYKDFQDIIAKIIEISPAKKRELWGRPVVEYNGKKFACSTKMTHEQREDLLKNKDKYIGKLAEIRYFELSNDGIPRFPVMHGIRLDK